MDTSTLIADVLRLEEEAAVLRRPEVARALSAPQRQVLHEVEVRIAALRKTLGL